MAEQSPASGARDDGREAGGPEGGGDGAAVAPDDDAARVVGLDSADADDVIGAVGSDTARAVLDALNDEPGTASGLAERVDRSLQTVQYHLGNLTDAGLVEVVGTTTSEKGREMDVYGPASRPVVVYAGGDDGSDLRSMLRRLVSAVGLLAVASLLVQELLARERAAGGAGDAVAMSAEAARETGGAAGVEPGLLFFAGGVAVLVAYVGWWHLRRRGHLDGLVPGG